MLTEMQVGVGEGKNGEEGSCRVEFKNRARSGRGGGGEGGGGGDVPVGLEAA